MLRRTAAAERILVAAVDFARRRSSASVEPVDLLAALIADESRGAELLARFAIHFEDAQTRELLGETLWKTPPPDELDVLTLAPVESDTALEVAEAAAREAGMAGRQAELGSEHLVVALSMVASSVRDLLVTRGGTAAELRQLTADAVDQPGQPIATDIVLDVSTIGFDRPYLLRAVDAAANRACEGLRVAEDYARFVRNDAWLTGELKRLRHAIVESLREVPLDERLAARDTRGDVGTTIASPSAETRQRETDLLAANIHRAEEALRSLEEFGRLLDPTLGPAFERLRYELYTIEKALAVSATSLNRLAGRALYALLTESQCRLPIDEWIPAVAAGGVGVIQVREKGVDDRALLARLKSIRHWTRDADVLMIVNDRADLAVLCDADGVHVGQDDLSVREARRIVGGNRLVGVSTHSLDQARKAVLDGADYLGVGPVFPSQTKAFDTFAGLDFVRDVAGEIGLPWYAIGGINADNLAEVRRAGACRIAVSAAVSMADDPRNIAAGLKAALRIETEQARPL